MPTLKKSCIHIAQADGRLIPFEAFNLFYRSGKEKLLADLRRKVLLPFMDEPRENSASEIVKIIEV